MKKVLVCLLLACSLGRAAALSLEEALQPLRDGVPEIAVTRLRKYLAQNPGTAEAKVRLAEALVKTEAADEALKVLADPSLTNNLSATFWRAQARAALGQWAEARADYERVAADAANPFRREAEFGEAQSLRTLGEGDKALRVFSSLREDPRWQDRASLGAADLLIDRGDLGGADRLLRGMKPERTQDRNERRYLFGRIHLRQRHYDRAIEIWSVILTKSERVSHPLLIATLLGVADAYLREGAPERGDDVLEEFIDHHPADPVLPILFAKLDALYQAEKKASPNELARWGRDPAQPRRALAQWYLARSQLRAGDRNTALATLNRLDQSATQLPSLGEAHLELAGLLLADQQWNAALNAAEVARRQNPQPDFQARADWLSAETNYRAGRLAKAAPIFEQIAQRSPGMAAAASFNAALCWLRIDQPEKFTSNYQLIKNDPAEQGELLLEEGAVQAAQGKAEAVSSFQKFIHNFPQSPRVSEAWVALAEIAYHERKPDLATARQNLARARLSKPTAVALERADYLDIWLEDAGSSTDRTQVISAATTFLQKHPGSAFTAEVRMKLAEAYFRRQDFANAQTQFEVLAQENPTAPLAEKALFFAGRSAMSSMGTESLDHALALLDQVVKLNGDLKWAARNEEAAIERRLGKNRDALAIYDEVLKNPAKAPDRREALCGKGDVFYEMGAGDPQNYRRAIELFDQLAREEGVPSHWRNQADFKKGKALEQLNDRAGALATYYSVIEDGAQPARRQEMFWFYKAGFNAAHLLEDASDWKSAVAVYRKLAALGGGRSEEARARLKQLRLEHFLWDE